MIKYDYEIIRDENDERVNYVPEFSTEIQNLSFVEGPNSSGKSTLLNLLAMAFNAEKNEKINIDLRNKITNLKNSDYQQVKFNFEIDQKDGSKILIEKYDLDKKDIFKKLIINGKKENINLEDYELIYDIPDNPITRIRELVKDFNLNQVNYLSKMVSLRSRVEEIIKEINESKNPKRIKQLEDLKELKEKELKDFENDLDLSIKKIDKLKIFAYNKLYKDVSKSYHYTENKLNLLEKEKKKKDIKKKSNNTRYQNLYRSLNDSLYDFKIFVKDLNSNVNYFLEDDKEKLFELNKIDLEILKDANNNDFFLQTIYNTLDYYQEKLKEKKETLISNSERQEISIYKEMLKVLDKYSINNKELEVFHKSFNLIKSDIINYLNSYSENFEKYSRLTDFLEEFFKVNGLLITISKNTKEILKSKPEENTDDSYNVDLEEDFNDLKSMLEKLRIKKEKYEALCKKCGFMSDEEIRKSLKEKYYEYDILKEDELEVKIERLKNKISDIEYKIRRCREQIEHNNRDLEAIKNKEEHKYSNNLSKLEKILKILQSLQGVFNKKFITWSKNIVNNNKPEVCEEDEEFFYKSVFLYLAKKIDKLNHIDNVIKVKELNLFKNEIISDTNKIIRFEDMGTGQSQSVYLQALLSNNSSKKKVVLFDEVAMMSKDSLKPIIEKLKELYNENKLLLAIIVQKNDNERIVRSLI